MKRSRILLEFTSLLDIMMILLFSFMMHSADSAQKEIEKAVNEKNAAVAQIEQRKEQLEEDKQKFEKEKEEWKKQAEKELDTMKKADENAAANAEALLNFQKGVVFKIDLEMESEKKWVINVFNGDNPIRELSSDDFGDINLFDIKNELNNILDENGFKEEGVIICIFMYNAGDKGTSRITDKGNLIEKIKSVREDKYKNFYCVDIKK